MNELIQTRWFPIALLSVSNIVMTFAAWLCAKVWSSMDKTLN